MAKKSGVREKIMMLSTGKTKDGRDTGFFYTTQKNKRNTPDKLELVKFDPRAWNESTGRYGQYVKFKEKKIPK